MSGNLSSISSGPSSVNLVRSSHSWTETDSAAGFVLRYLSPMRRQLTVVLGSQNEADQALKLLLTHLVAAGFGEHKKGRLRDFLVRALRSCAKARLKDLGRLEVDKDKLSGVSLESREWVVQWRECLLERAWRALERMEHHDPQNPMYSVLWTSTTHPEADLPDLAREIKKERGLELDEATIGLLRVDAKAMFAQLLADEVVETLENPDRAAVKQEIKTLGIGSVFRGLNV